MGKSNMTNQAQQVLASDLQSINDFDDTNVELSNEEVSNQNDDNESIVPNNTVTSITNTTDCYYTLDDSDYTSTKSSNIVDTIGSIQNNTSVSYNGE